MALSPFAEQLKINGRRRLIAAFQDDCLSNVYRWAGHPDSSFVLRLQGAVDSDELISIRDDLQRAATRITTFRAKAVALGGMATAYAEDVGGSTGVTNLGAWLNDLVAACQAVAVVAETIKNSKDAFDQERNPATYTPAETLELHDDLVTLAAAFDTAS